MIDAFNFLLHCVFTGSMLEKERKSCNPAGLNTRLTLYIHTRHRVKIVVFCK